MADHSHHRLLAPDYSVRHYEGEQQAHSHDHVQLLYALAGRMELEVDGKAAYVDTASGVVIPAGSTHAYLAQKGSALAVVDVPDGADWTQMRRFAAPPRDWLATHASALTVAQAHVAWVQQSPQLLLRRALDVQAITAAVRPWRGQPQPAQERGALMHGACGAAQAQAFLDICPGPAAAP